MWLTSLINGIYYLSSQQFNIWTKENGLMGNKINCLSIAPDSSLWVSSSTSNTVTVIRNDTVLYHTINSINNLTIINSILFHTDNTVWFGSSLRLSIYNMGDFSCHLPAKFEAGAKDMLQNDDGTVWVNGIGNLYLFKTERNSIVVLKQISTGTRIKKIAIDRDSILWLGTLNGLYQYRNTRLINFSEYYPALKKSILDLKVSPNGDLWIGTSDTGLIYKSGNHFAYYNVKNGLVNNCIQCLSFDYKGNLWVGTYSGLSHLFIHYDKVGNCIVDSIENTISPNLKEINCIACIKDMVYAGTNNGLISFDMNKININTTPPPIYITSLKINNKNFPIGTNGLSLNYDENNIVINYVGLTYRDVLNTLYRYRMNGIDTGWVYTQYTNVQYPKLPPGEYIFLVSARNADGIWSKSNAAISFIIDPPLWGRWWAKTLLVFILISLIYWRIRVIIKQERMKADTSQQLIEMQLRELREQMDPHFLFNNLSTLSYLVESKSPSASVFVNELSQYFRYSLQSRNAEFTELKNELKQAERYLHLLEIRYSGMLTVSWNIEAPMLEYFISNHSLQLLLENITKHNILSNESPLFVDIITTNYCSLIIKNNLQPKIVKEESTGLGLKSIDERYYLLFKKNIKITRTSDYFFVELPLLTPEEYEHTDN